MAIRHLIKRERGFAVVVVPTGTWKAIFEHTNGNLKFKTKINRNPTIRVFHTLAQEEKPDTESEETVAISWLRFIPQ